MKKTKNIFILKHTQNKCPFPKDLSFFIHGTSLQVSSIYPFGTLQKHTTHIVEIIRSINWHTWKTCVYLSLFISNIFFPFFIFFSLTMFWFREMKVTPNDIKHKDNYIDPPNHPKKISLYFFLGFMNVLITKPCALYLQEIMIYHYI